MTRHWIWIAVVVLVTGCGPAASDDNRASNQPVGGSSGNTAPPVDVDWADDQQVRKAYGAATGNPSGPADILLHRPATLPGVIFISDMPQPDAGEAVRRGGFVNGVWRTPADLQPAVFASLGWAAADADGRVRIVQTWVTSGAVVGATGTPTVRALDSGGVEATVRVQRDFNVGGEPMFDADVTMEFGPDGHEQ